MQCTPSEQIEYLVKCCKNHGIGQDFLPWQWFVTARELGENEKGEPDMEMPEESTNPQLRAVTYMRVATSRQHEAERAIVAQQHVCEQRAFELGAEVVGEYVDRGFSANTLERPALRAMIEALQSDPCDYVIVCSHNEVARNAHVYVQVVWLIEEAGARLHIASLPRAAQLAESTGAYLEEIGLRQHEITRKQKLTDEQA